MRARRVALANARARHVKTENSDEKRCLEEKNVGRWEVGLARRRWRIAPGGRHQGESEWSRLLRLVVVCRELKSNLVRARNERLQAAVASAFVGTLGRNVRGGTRCRVVTWHSSVFAGVHRHFGRGTRKTRERAQRCLEREECRQSRYEQLVSFHMCWARNHPSTQRIGQPDREIDTPPGYGYYICLLIRSARPGFGKEVAT